MAVQASAASTVAAVTAAWCSPGEDVVPGLRIDQVVARPEPPVSAASTLPCTRPRR
ncbi:MAG TPA: hypothetical protein VET24_17480 [Actinomycetota bacterium]|nr:hypothetical protein [Actinomycetota bacterium]